MGKGILRSALMRAGCRIPLLARYLALFHDGEELFLCLGGGHGIGGRFSPWFQLYGETLLIHFSGAAIAAGLRCGYRRPPFFSDAFGRTEPESAKIEFADRRERKVEFL